MAADVMTIILAAAAGVTVYLVAHFVIGQIRIPIYPFIIAIVLAVITAGVVYFTLRNNRTEVADWWNRNVGSNRGLD